MISNYVWILPRPRLTGFRGADIGGFPLHFEKKLIKFLFGRMPSGLFNIDILHPFGGRAEYGLRVDLRVDVAPDVIADAHALPFRDACFDLVILDPPYNNEEAMKLYGTGPLSYNLFLNEAVRVCREAGFVAAYHWAITPRPADCSYYARIFIGGRVWHRPRVCCIWQKSSKEQP